MAYLSEDVIRLHATGLTQRQIAAQLGCGLNTVRRRMKELDLQPKSRGSRNYQINSDVFDNIDTEDKAYWLGFLLADGCVAKSAGSRRMLRLSLKRSDEKHVRLAAKFVGFKGKYHYDNRNNHPRVLMAFNDVRLCRTLMDYGWWNYKTGKSFEILDIIPDALFHHFVRGYYDGDGSITYLRRKRKDRSAGPQKKWYCNITCKYQLALEHIDRRIVSLGGPHSKVKLRSHAYDLRWTNRIGVSAITSWMYKDAHVLLGRKLSRRHEFDGLLPFIFNNVCDFHFNFRTDDLIARKDRDEIIKAFTAEVLASSWKPPKYDYDEDLREALTPVNCIENNKLVPKSSAGNQFVLKYQPLVWHIRQNQGPALANFANYPTYVERAIKNFCGLPGKTLTPARFIRELRFAGFSMASLLPVPILLSAMRYFGLSGTWLDPCAGWGNRLLAAHIAGAYYTATDPGVSYDGLTKMQQDLGIQAELYNSKWQDLTWPEKVDFVLTSPPFHNKEDYLDGVEYGKFKDWYTSFLKPLVDKSLAHATKVVLHVDVQMRQALLSEQSYKFDELPMTAGNRHKAPAEWFISIQYL